MSANESHLQGKSFTVVYEITDPVAWRKHSPLDYVAPGAKAFCMSVGDLSEIRDRLCAALKRIGDEGDAASRAIARAALDLENES